MVDADIPEKAVKAKRPGVIRSSVIFAALTMVSRLMGLARDLVITARLGASMTIAVISKLRIAFVARAPSMVHAVYRRLRVEGPRILAC